MKKDLPNRAGPFLYWLWAKLLAAYRNGHFPDGDALDGIQREDLIKHAAELTAGGISLRPGAAAKAGQVDAAAVGEGQINRLGVSAVELFSGCRAVSTV